MFIPSLSWYNVRFNVYMAQKVAFFAPVPAPMTPHGGHCLDEGITWLRPLRDNRLHHGGEGETPSF
jgi:hypothetical protein